MGIPYFFSHITRRNPDLIVDHNNDLVDYLFLDFNCAIHHCNSELQSKHGIVEDIEQYESNLIEECMTYIRNIVATVKLPVKCLFISIDGVVPRAKMIQQRRRRFLSSWRKTKEGAKAIWDTNAISPGTNFMRKLNKAVSNLKAREVGCDEIISSDSEEPGEGEHKIFEFMKQNSIENKKIIIYGLDADLIMLSLLINGNNKIDLMRESKFYRLQTVGEFLFLKVNLLREKLIENLRDLPGNHKIETYVFISFLIGNDFMPSLSYLKLKNDGIDYMLSCIQRICEDSNQTIVYFDDGKWNIDWTVFQQLISKIATNEDAEYKKMHYRYYSTTLKENQDPYDFYGIHNKPVDKINPNVDGWRHRFYDTLFPDVKVTSICKSYVESVKWTFEYYFNSLLSTEWYYKYDYSPTAFDLNNFLQIFDLEDIKIEENRKFSESSVSLLHILPLSSHHLLNETSKKRSLSISNAQYFPIDFKVQTYLKTYLHDCIPQLPSLMAS